MRFSILVLVAGLIALSLWTIVVTKQDILPKHLAENSIWKPSTGHGFPTSWQHAKYPPGACQILPQPLHHASTLALWTENIGKIHNASKLLPNDPEYEFSDLTAQLLHLISPRLPNSVKAIPRDWKSIKHVLEQVLYPRWNFIMSGRKESNEIPRPVKIVVMGGSVVSGINCLQVFSNKVRHSLSREQCAWPYRLQQFLDSIVGGTERRIFEVHTVAMGGSNTITGNSLLEFDLLPPEAKRPDIIVNAYATNDMHISTLNQGDGTENFVVEGSWREKVMSVLQEFIRLASSPVTACSEQSSSLPQADESVFPPILLHLDDYLGNEQREVLATTELSQAVQVLANYYGNFVAMSYPDIVRDWVYGDTHEAWFSPLGWYPTYKQDKTQMAREIHPGMPMHIAIPWIISYNMLNLLTTYCDRHVYQHDAIRPPQKDEEINPRIKILDEEYVIAQNEGDLQLPELKNNIRLPGKPKATPKGLPPPLSPDLSLQEITALWKSQGAVSSDPTAATRCTLQDSPKCPFAWVSGLLSGHNSLDEAGVESYFKQNCLSFFNHGWELRRHVGGKKMGYVPLEERPGANLTMVFTNADSSPIRQVVIFYLKSYGDSWNDSRLQVRLDRATTWEPIMQRQLAGFHAKNTSEMYEERIDLPVPNAGEDPGVRLQAVFISGKTFKIMGLLVCR